MARSCVTTAMLHHHNIPSTPTPTPTPTYPHTHTHTHTHTHNAYPENRLPLTFPQVFGANSHSGLRDGAGKRTRCCRSRSADISGECERSARTDPACDRSGSQQIRSGTLRGFAGGHDGNLTEGTNPTTLGYITCIFLTLARLVIICTRATSCTWPKRHYAI
jgi:hypothetical protein